MPNPRAPKPIIAEPSPNPLAEHLATAVASVAPESVGVVGDDIGLAEALTLKGLPVATDDGTRTAAVALTVIRLTGPVEESLGKLDPDAQSVLLWQEGEHTPGDWVRAAAGTGYFRSSGQPNPVDGVTLVLLDAARPTVPELVAAYEELLDGTAELGGRVRFLEHQLLTSRDHAIGAEGEIAQLRARTRELQLQIQDLLATTTWRVGTRFVGPLGRVKRALRR